MYNFDNLPQNFSPQEQIKQLKDLLNKKKLRVSSVSVPATATSAGVAGQIKYDASFIYICVAANSWKRVAIAAW